ncbi:hypothetical protein I302_105349 [Kwoniella bestiolae CBS 10118]|uniref:Protein CPL1-like domain-containing protein n=1 Tax=Kwoniella bestiolae CBS 10118 TaxID=1296100 RepID=A0A1B9FSW4_9TREE|nr:hypothetical protein I302_08634 [Kwoniella bestiolae CBS 10118]OCF21855.1 hypothetical protein I302_08634 [Kwoniella bestiolae CBS 10118]
MFFVACLASLLSLVSATNFVGCFSDPEVLEGQVGQLQPGIFPVDCLVNCANEGKIYTYEYAQYRNGLGYDQWCLCTNNAPDYRYITDGTGSCDPGFFSPGDVTVSTSLTSFTFVACYPSAGALDFSTQVGNLYECLTECSAYQFARLAFREGERLGYCFCYATDALWSGEHYTPCNQGDWYIYQQSNQPSSFVKRSKARLQYINQRESLCPEGLTACNLPSGPSDSYECIDISLDPESCGGCLHGRYESDIVNHPVRPTIGIDCTALENIVISDVTCVQGQCVVGACEEGFALQHGACVA